MDVSENTKGMMMQLDGNVPQNTYTYADARRVDVNENINEMVMPLDTVERQKERVKCYRQH